MMGDAHAVAAEGLHAQCRTRGVSRRERLELHAEQLAQRAVDIEMDARLVVGVADLLDAFRDVGRESKQLLPFQADVILNNGEGGMRQQVRSLQDRAIELERVVLVTGGEAGDRRLRDGRAVFGAMISAIVFLCDSAVACSSACVRP